MAKQASDSRAATLKQSERWTEQHARQVLEAWEKSGETAAAFAQHLGVLPQRLFWWRRRLEQDRRSESTSVFVPVTVRPAVAPASPARSASVVVTVGERVRLEVQDMDATTATWVAALLLNLGQVRS